MRKFIKILVIIILSIAILKGIFSFLAPTLGISSLYIQDKTGRKEAQIPELSTS